MDTRIATPPNLHMDWSAPAPAPAARRPQPVLAQQPRSARKGQRRSDLIAAEPYRHAPVAGSKEEVRTYLAVKLREHMKKAAPALTPAGLLHEIAEVEAAVHREIDDAKARGNDEGPATPGGKEMPNATTLDKEAVGTMLRAAAEMQGWRDDGKWVPGQGPLLLAPARSKRIVRVVERPEMSGGFGSVAKAYNGDGQEFAAKLAHPEQQQALDNELAMYRKVYEKGTHRNVLNVYGMASLPGGRQAMLMDNVSGPNGAEGMHRLLFCMKNNIITFKEYMEAVQFVGLRLLDGVLHLHQADIIHCDLKPANFGFNSQGEPIVLDLGGARHIGEVQRGGGTPSYAAPEQQGAPVPYDGRIDVFAIGASMLSAVEGYQDGKAKEGPPITESMVVGGWADREKGRFARAGLSAMPGVPWQGGRARPPGMYAPQRPPSELSTGETQPVFNSSYTDFMVRTLQRDPALRATAAEARELKFLTDPPTEDDGAAAKATILKCFKYTDNLVEEGARKEDDTARVETQRREFLAAPSLPAYLEMRKAAYRAKAQKIWQKFLLDSRQWEPQVVNDLWRRAGRLQRSPEWVNTAEKLLLLHPTPDGAPGVGEPQAGHVAAPSLEEAEERLAAFRASVLRDLHVGDVAGLGRGVGEIDAMFVGARNWHDDYKRLPSGADATELLPRYDMAVQQLQQTAAFGRGIVERDAALVAMRDAALAGGASRHQEKPKKRRTEPLENMLRQRAGAGQPARRAGRPGGAGA